MPSRSVRDIRQRPEPVMGIRPTSPQPVQPRPIQSTPTRGPAVVGSGNQVATPQIQAQPAPTQNIQQGMMAQINAAPQQPRVAVPVTAAPIGQAPGRVATPVIRNPNIR